MACSHPLLAVNQGKREDGKINVRIITRLDSVSSVEDAIEKFELCGHKVMLLPCGKCPGCLKTRRKQWAIRCENEAKYYAENCFVTLTYDDDHLRTDSKQCKKDYQLFLQLLRNKGI